MPTDIKTPPAHLLWRHAAEFPIPTPEGDRGLLVWSDEEARNLRWSALNDQWENDAYTHRAESGARTPDLYWTWADGDPWTRRSPEARHREKMLHSSKQYGASLEYIQTLLAKDDDPRASGEDRTSRQYNLPWTIEEIDRYDDDANPAYEVRDSNGNVVLSDQTYYPTAPERPVAEAIVLLMNGQEPGYRRPVTGRAPSSPAVYGSLDGKQRIPHEPRAERAEPLLNADFATLEQIQALQEAFATEHPNFWQQLKAADRMMAGCHDEITVDVDPKDAEKTVAKLTKIMQQDPPTATVHFDPEAKVPATWDPLDPADHRDEYIAADDD